MLIDQLEARADSIKLITPNSTPRIEIDDEAGIWIKVDDIEYAMTQDAFEILLNLIRVPIKYVERMIEEDASSLAQDNINFWLQGHIFNYLLDESLVVTQIFDSKKMYIPGLRINDAILEHFESEASVLKYDTQDDVFYALYLSEDMYLTYQTGISVLYSDCFNMPPRFDGVLYDASKNLIWTYPITNRKFRVASNKVDDIMSQVEEFISLAIEQTKSELAPILQDRIFELHEKVDFVERLCSDLRLNKKIAQDMISAIGYDDKVTLAHIYGGICGACRNMALDIASTRDIQVAIAKFVVNNKFK